MRKLLDISSRHKKELSRAPIEIVAASCRSEISKEVTTEEKEFTEDVSKNSAAILMRSTPVDERSDSWSDEYDSSDLEVDYETEDEELDDQVILARIRRLGTQKGGIWTNSMEFYSVTLAFLISPDAILSAVYGFRKFGSRIMFPTMLGAFFLGFPVMFMEIALGQYTATSTVSVFRSIAPAFSAISGLSTWMNIFVALNDFTLFAMTISVLKDLLETESDQLMATSCFNSWNSLACENALNPCAPLAWETGRQYLAIQGRCVQKRWYTDVLYKDIQIGHNLRQLTPQFTYLVNYLTSVNQFGRYAAHFPSTDRLIYVCAIFIILLLVYNLPKRAMVFYAKIPLLMIFVFFGTVLLTPFNKESEANHTGFPIKHDPIHWLSTDFLIWLVGHVFLVSKIGQGCLISIGSQNPFRSNLFKHVFVLNVFAFSIPYLFAYLIYPFMDKLLWNAVGDWTLFNEKKKDFFGAHTGINAIWSDVLLAFFADDNNGEIFGSLFIFTLISIFAVHKIIRLQTLIQPAVEKFGITNRADMGLLQVVLLYLLHIFCYNNFLEPNRTISLYVNMSGCAFVVIFEIICVFGFFGARRLLCAFNLMTFGIMTHNKNIWRTRLRESFNLVLAAIFGSVAFLFCPYLLFHVFWSASQWVAGGGNLIFAMGASAFFFLVIPLYAVYQVWDRYSKNHLIINLFKPIPDLWGPREEHDRRRAEYQERQMRVG